MAAPPKTSAQQPWGVRHLPTLRALSFALSLAPAVWLCGETLTDSLGPNPLNRLLHFSGQCALTMLLVTLAVTPLRRLAAWASTRLRSARGKRLADWGWLIRLRRQFGLFAFAYASAHLLLYVWLDAGLQFAEVVADLRERPFIALGFAAWLLLVPLAATSTASAMRRLGRRWQLLHRLVHPVLLLVLAHQFLRLKVGQPADWGYLLGATVLLAARLVPRGARRPARERGEDESDARPVDHAAVGGPRSTGEARGAARFRPARQRYR